MSHTEDSPFPRVPSLPSPESVPEQGFSTSAPARDVAILVVEDTPGSLLALTETLAPLGERIVPANSAREALRLHLDQRFALILLNVQMPGMSGPELAGALTSSRPGTRVLFMPGYTDDTVLRHGVLTQERSLIQKPFSAAAPVRKLQEVLHGEASV